MSKNNDEIVESVLPKPLFKEEDFDGVFVRNKDIGYLKQALTEKKLCVPLSVNQISKVLYDLMQNQFKAVVKAVDKKGLINTDWNDIDSNGGSLDFNVIAKAIYEAQFNDKR